MKWSHPCFFEEDKILFDLSIFVNRHHHGNTHFHNMFIDLFIANLGYSLLPKPPDPFVVELIWIGIFHVFSMEVFNSWRSEKDISVLPRKDHDHSFSSS